MSLIVKKRKEPKKVKIDKKEFIKDILDHPQRNSICTNINNEFSLFNKRNLDLIHKSNKENKEKNIENKNANNQIKNKNYKNYKYKCILSPHECQSLPLIIINSNKNTVFSQCPANGHSNELTNPHEPDETVEISINEYLKKISELYNYIKCSKCSKKYEPNTHKKNNNKSKLSEEEDEEEEEEEDDEENDNNSFFLCYSCNTYFCNKCKEEHIKQKNVNDNNKAEKHYIINIDYVGCYCLYHNQKNFGYCNVCKQNICVKCVNENMHKLHDIILFKNIMVNTKEVNEIKNKIDIEKKNLEFFENAFLENLNKIKTKFYSLLDIKKNICKLKQILINEYEKKSFNYQMIMTCLKMEFNTKNLTIFNKMKEENPFDIINLIFDTLNEKRKYTYKKTKIDNFTKKKEKEKEKINNDSNIYDQNSFIIDKEIEKEKENKENKDIIKGKKIKKKKLNKKIISNSFSLSNDLIDEENNSQINIKKDHSNNSPLNTSNNYNKKNPIRVKINNNILNSLKDIKDNIVEKNDINKAIFNKKYLTANLTNRSIKEEKTKDDDYEEGNNNDEDDLLFFPKKSCKLNEKKTNKIIQIKLKSLGEEFLTSDEGRAKDKKVDKLKSPKFKKNKIYKMKENDIKELILEDIQNKSELFSSLNINYNCKTELLDEANNQKNNEPYMNIVNNESTKLYNIKPIVNKDNINNNNDKSNNNVEREKKIEIEKKDKTIKNNVNHMLHNSKESSKSNLKKKTKKKMVMVKNEFYDDDKNIRNSNNQLENEVKLQKGNENRSDNHIINSVYLTENSHKPNPNLNSIILSNSNSLKENNKINTSIKIYQHHTKNKTKEIEESNLKYSLDNIHIPNKDKNNNKKNLTSVFKEMKNNDKDYGESEEDENFLSFDSLIKIKNTKKFEKKNNKAILVKKNLVEKPIKSINDNNEIVVDSNIKMKKDNKGRIYSINIKDDPVWCVLSMKNNEYISVGLASGIIKLFDQNEFKEKMYIEEHTGAIYSMYLTKKNSNCFLTSSTDKLIKKILISDDFTNYTVVSTLKGHNSSVYKAIELNNNQILSCSDDGLLILWENKNEEKEKNKNDNPNVINNPPNNNNSLNSSNLNKSSNINDFLNVENNGSKKNLLNNYVMNNELNQMLNQGEIIYDILQINNEIFVSSSLYGYLRFWNINTMKNTDIIREMQCNDSHNCLCIINKTIMGVLLNEKYGIALVDYVKKEVTHKIIVEKNVDIKLSTILLTSNKLVVIGGQNNASKEESLVIYKFYKIIKVKKANSTSFKYSLKILNEHIKSCPKLLPEDDIWLNAITEGSNGSIINGLGSTYMNKEYGQIYIYFKDKNMNEVNKESRNSLNDINRNKK